MKQIKIIDQAGNQSTIYVNKNSIVSVERLSSKLTESLNHSGPFSKVIINEGGEKRQVIAIGSPSSLNESSGGDKQILHG